ncbi:MAG TPA: NUDIX domain-containing protein [Candidatus Saccharimonadales bacterium]
MLLSMDLSTHGIVALVRDGDGKFLLLEDSREPMKGCWAPPHGRCELTDASEEEGVIREVREETGLAVLPVRRVLTQPADTKIKTVSFWVVIGESSDPKLNEESVSFGWFSVDEALSLELYPGTRVFFEKVKSGEVEL